MVFFRIPSVLVPIDKETVADVKYYSKQYISIIGFSYADKVLSSGFHSKVGLIAVIFSRCDEEVFVELVQFMK